MITGRSGQPHGGPPHGGRPPSVAAEAEGYLLARAQHEEACREAEELCARLPWLTGAQAQDVTRQYVRRRAALTRRMLLDTVARADDLRQEYERHYADLRRALLKGHAAWACAVLAGAGGLGACVGLTAR
ncbi:hypothetical protein [Streptomyces ziwulingensis]|uniref:Cytochrome C oxidase subunit I n=1 Tax=Streptomyces ziwulingensis TaxID=1045501 RepID=A0ABP9CST5_9ACTN